MKTLSVRAFSCLDEADIALAPITVLIGPQAAGKSVISKLAYFGQDVIGRQYAFISEERPIEEFSAGIAKEFVTWFPPTAWGEGAFRIEFSSGPYTITIVRRQTRQGPNGKVVVSFSDYFTKQYDELLNLLRDRKRSRKAPEGEETDPTRDLELSWFIRDYADRRMRKDFDTDYTDFQLFIPAGRAFFTSMGKAYAAIEQGLDPITARFGRLFAWMRDRPSFFRSAPSQNAGDGRRRDALMKKLFGGQLRFGPDHDVVETTDGRKLPFSLLSSGQQELLPLWMALDYFTRVPRQHGLVYIEEPEAHLFPSAQSLLTEYLVRLVTSARSNRRIILTTHSPYLLTKLNNLLKAGKLTEGKASKAIQDQVASVLPRETWLSPGSTTAYAIENRKVRCILDDTGLIDAEYLDEISNAMMREFSDLLAIEDEHDGD